MQYKRLMSNKYSFQLTYQLVFLAGLVYLKNLELPGHPGFQVGHWDLGPLVVLQPTTEDG